MNNTPKLYLTGNEKLLKRIKTAFLCSRQTPERKTVFIYDWLKHLSPEADCIICGNHSQMEQDVFNALLKQHIPTILVLAEGLPNRWNAEIEAALHTNLLLIITPCDNTVHRVNKVSAYDRNELILSIAEQIVIGYCREGGNINKQLKGKKNITYLNRTEYKSETMGMNWVAETNTVNNLASSKERSLFLNIKRDSQGKDYLEITRNESKYTNGFIKEILLINKEEITQLKKELDKVIELWGLNISEKKYTLNSKREEYGNAYLPWEKSADEYLLKLYSEGRKISELSEIFERNKGAIRSRLKHLGVH